LEKIANRAYKEIAMSPEYSCDGFTKKCGQVLSEEIKARRYDKYQVDYYTKREFKTTILFSYTYFFYWYIARNLQRIFFSQKIHFCMFWCALKMPHSLLRIIRPMLKIIGR
jgi:hypothetical protein